MTYYKQEKKVNFVKSLSSFSKGVAFAAAMAGFSATTAYAKDLRIAIGLPETYPHYTALVNFSDYLKEHADIDAKVFSLSLLNLAETSPGVRDGIADAGFTVFPYNPTEYSEASLFANLTMLATSGEQTSMPGAVMAGATMEYILFKCPECLVQNTAQNQLFVGGTSTDPYTLLCNTPIRSLADLKGKKFRSGAANFGRWAEFVGGTKVAIPGNGTYEALEQGVVDCSMSNVGDLLANRFIDVTSHVILGVPGGVFSGLGANSINLDVWHSFTDKERAVYLRGSANLAADSVLGYRDIDTRALIAAKEKGLDIMDATDDMIAASIAFVAGDLATISEEFTTQYGLQNVDAKIATAQELVSRWKGLIAEIDGSPEELANLYWTEVLSKVDPKTYGMN